MSIPHLTRCRVCRCTEIEPCLPPCGWEHGEQDLCTNCAEVIRKVQDWLIGGLHPSWAALKREAEKAHAPGAKRKGAAR
jgi:hypothetical protein